MMKKLWTILFTLIILSMTSCAKPSDIEEWESDESVTVAEEENETAGEELIYVYLCGEVNNPGVYALNSTQRVFEAINLAGGLTDKADINSINQAKGLTDGEMIYISSYEEAETEKTRKTQVSDGKVNINTAGVQELVCINGIGQSRAEAIVAYRQEHGVFKNTKDIMQVSGIKSGLYEKIKDKIKTE